MKKRMVIYSVNKSGKSAFALIDTVVAPNVHVRCCAGNISIDNANAVKKGDTFELPTSCVVSVRTTQDGIPWVVLQ